MAETVTIVSGVIAPERQTEVEGPYRAAIAGGLPPGLTDTMLLRGEDGRVTIVSVWATRADLDAMRASGNEPLARRLIREAGGTPEVGIHEVLARGAHPSR
jgi:heme-degrading monooxygenase HmoA